MDSWTNILSFVISTEALVAGSGVVIDLKLFASVLDGYVSIMNSNSSTYF